uniref:DNA mismatch repair proteins mutS family domain-containing protein n=1 Tax=Spongospora subterranea TaxID=70186 RepID=A0A0H5QLG6_9EUKA|eukprot:CRZ02201.1 hypothetical protein [Spongospora subterranea]
MSSTDMASFQIDPEDRRDFFTILSRFSSGPSSPVRLFRHPDNVFAVYGPDAEMVAVEFYQNSSFARTVNIPADDEDGRDDSLQYINIGPQRVEKFLGMVTCDKKRAVVLYAQSGKEWAARKELGSGDHGSIDEFLFLDAEETSEQSSLVFALSFQAINQGLVVGVAAFDPVMQEFAVCQFADDHRYSCLESIIVEHSPKECIVDNSKPAEDQNLVKLFESRSIPFSLVNKNLFSTASLEHDLKRLLSGNIQQYLVDLEKTVAMKALAGLLHNVGASANDALNGRCSLVPLELHEFMKPLDSNASRALNLFPSISDPNTDSSLFGVLNKCKTASGTRLLHQWIRQPLMSISAINDRLDLVEAFSKDSHLNSTFRDSFLKKVPDLTKLSMKFQTGRATLADCVQLYQFTVHLPLGLSVLGDIFDLHQDDITPLFSTKIIVPLQQINGDFNQFNQLIEKTVDFEAIDRHEFIVRADFAAELMSMKKNKDVILSQIDELANKMDEELSMSGKLKLNYKDGLGYHLRVTRKEEKALRGHRKVICLETRKDGVRFTTTELKALNASYNEISSHYNKFQNTVVEKCLSVVASYCPLIDHCGRILSKVDVLSSFAFVANHSNGYVRPVLLAPGSRTLRLKASRHPCLELQPHVESYVSNDVEMDADRRFQIITGPNMGGKSTYLRQIALIVIMAQIGSFVPCDSATVTVCDRILSRIGAGDSQLRGISTFYAEMLEASSMLRLASKNSLIIIDELGRGTSTSEGFGLAWAISDYICHRLQCLSLFATHFHELTELSFSCSAVVNRHVTAHTSDNHITMLYEVVDGACDRSFGIHVAEIAQFPPEVIQMAREKIIELESVNSANERENDRLFFAELKKLPIDSMSDDDLLRACSSMLDVA